MPRTKKPAYARLRTPGGMIWVGPSKEGTWPIWHGKIPALDVMSFDGREIYVTFESETDTSKEVYARRMRTMAETLLREARRIETDGI